MKRKKENESGTLWRYNCKILDTKSEDGKQNLEKMISKKYIFLLSTYNCGEFSVVYTVIYLKDWYFEISKINVADVLCVFLETLIRVGWMDDCDTQISQHNSYF